MSDPFTRLRRKQAERVNAAPAATGTPEAPVATYKVLFLNRGWAMALLLIWTPLAGSLIVLMIMNEAALNAIPYSTGLRVLAMLLFFASLIVVPLLVPTTRRHWTLWRDAVEIRERPYVPLLGRYRRARLPFAEIAIARKGELLSGIELFELEGRDRRRFRLLPTSIGSGKAAVSDHAGFANFIEAIRETISASGAPVPPGEELRTVTSGLTGVVILGVITALFGAAALAGVVLLMTGEAIGLQILAFMVPFGLLFGGLLRDRWRKWQARAG